MSNFRLNLPVDIPWKLVNSSEDMIDSKFCDSIMPSPFRSSLALFAYEPKEEDLPEEMCGKSLMYLKVSCSITGFTPDEDDLLAIYDLSKYGVGEEVLTEFINRTYLACYGVKLNISVFSENMKIDDFNSVPHIIDFEPKKREFYQSASEYGEVLTGSSSTFSTGKSMTLGFSTEEGYSQTSSIEGKGEDGSAMISNSEYGKSSDSLNLGDSQTRQTSQDKRETMGSTTQLSQMYNLLSSYHIGTNRVTVVLLPRPHQLQPTNRRTIVDGLRMIEGIQDFVFIVEKNKNQSRLQVELNLETGHYHENVDEIPINPKIEEEKTRLVSIINKFTVSTKGIFFQKIFSVPQENDEEIDLTYNNGQVNRTKHTQTPSDQLWDSDLKIHSIDWSNDDTNSFLVYYNYERGSFFGFNPGAKEVEIDDEYTVRVKKSKTKNIETKANPDQLITVLRKLCTTIEADNRCLKKVDSSKVSGKPKIVKEYDINIDRIRNVKAYYYIIQILKSGIVTPDLNFLIKNPNGIRFSQTNLFKEYLLRILPKDALDSHANQFDFINIKVKEKLSKEVSLKDLLSSNEHLHSEQFGISKNEILNLKNQT